MLWVELRIEGRAVDQDIQAFEVLQSGGNHLAYRAGIGHVRLCRDGLAPTLGDDVSQGGCSRAVDVGYDYPGAGLRQGAAELRPEQSRPAGDDGHASGQVEKVEGDCRMRCSPLSV